MMEARHRPKPRNWSDFYRCIVHRWLLPFLLIDWITAWAAYFLSKTSILEFLEYCGSFSILIGVIFYFMDAPERTKIKHYQAWQVINTAQGKGGSGGRGEALHELNEDHVPLVGVDLTDAFLQNVDLQHADLRRGRFHGGDLKEANLSGSNLEQSVLIFTNLRDSKLVRVNFTDCDLTDADLEGATLAGCTLHNADFTRTDLRGADLANAADWKSIASLQMADIHGIQHAPDGFAAWAIGKGAVDIASDEDWAQAIRRASTQK
jgi:Pentapeptide repeats (8 copies)